ncbi:uncharacterized protein [Ptychodera flava]|uniref:uncharacterized protein n=1 Tax=Ptychodera flava TaxID=63121 RepID=UPI003969BEB7
MLCKYRVRIMMYTALSIFSLLLSSCGVHANHCLVAEFEGTDGEVSPSQIMPDMRSMTVCIWMKTCNVTRRGTLVSYAVSNQSEELVINYNATSIRTVIKGHSEPIALNVADCTWHHICLTWTSQNGDLKFYYDGVRLVERTDVGKGGNLKGGGRLVLGQRLRYFDGEFIPEEAFCGSLAEFNVWPIENDDTEINYIRYNRGKEGSAIPWNYDFDLDSQGHVKLVYYQGSVCPFTPSREFVCPSNIERKDDSEKGLVAVTWTFLEAAATCTPAAGSNFIIGNTVVFCKIDISTTKFLSCSFNVTVTTDAFIRLMALIDDRDASPVKIPTSQMIEFWERVSANISMLPNVNFPEDKIKSLAQDVLEALQRAVTFFQNKALERDESKTDKNLLMISVLNTTENLAKFVLRNTEPGIGPVVLDTAFIHMNLQSDSVEKLTNGSVVMEDGNSFALPSMETLFPNLTSPLTINRIVSQLNKSSFNLGNRDQANDVLSVSFTTKDGAELEVKDTKEDIKIVFSSDPSEPDTHAWEEGVYHEVDDVILFRSEINISELYHAAIIQLESSTSIYGNSTLYIYNHIVEYMPEFKGYQFSVEVHFLGDSPTAFIPENYFLKSGLHYLVLTIPHERDLNISITMKHIACNYLSDTGVWNGDGCKVSPGSNMTSTVCLCNHLTTFVAMAEQEHVMSLPLR